MTTQTTDMLTLLKNMYAAEAEYLAAGGPGEATFELLAPFFASDVVLHQADALPYGGPWRGHDGMEKFFLAMSHAWTAFDLVDQKFLATEGTAVVMTQVHARARATGRELDFPILQTVEARNGRITDIRPFYWDTAAIANACTQQQTPRWSSSQDTSRQNPPPKRSPQQAGRGNTLGVGSRV